MDIEPAQVLDTVGLVALMYEGLVLAGRLVTGQRLAPTISEVVWSLKPHRFGWVPPVVVCGWLFWHLEHG